MDNDTGTLVFVIWTIFCMLVAARGKTLLGVAATGFMLSWIGMVLIGIIVGEHMRSLGGKGLHGMMALYAGWVPCLIGSVIFAGLRTVISQAIKKRGHHPSVATTEDDTFTAQDGQG